MTKLPKRIRPYEGNESYIFVSYSHRNEQAALRILRTLIESGFRVWYDEGINPGTDWADVIADHIRNCGCFLSLLSPEYVESENCQAEINYAIKHKRDSLPVYLSPTELPSGIDMYMSRFQAIFAHTYEDEGEFFDKLFRARGIEQYCSTDAKPRKSRARVTKPDGEGRDSAKKKKATRTPKSEGMDALPDLDESFFSAADEAFSNNAMQNPFGVNFEEDEALTPIESPALPALPVKLYDPEKGYVPPSPSLLHETEPLPREDADEIRTTAEKILEVFAASGVQVASIEDYHHGHAVTRYEFRLHAGVRMNRVLSLADDLTLALGASGGIRIEAPVPGTDRIGIEVPNRQHHVLRLRQLWESPEFEQASAPLTAALGADVEGNPITLDLAKMPHLLIGGSTGGGKSVTMHAILASLLRRNSPESLRLVLIDPKSVEFTAYRGIPHLLTPVITRPREAIGALQAIVEEMNARYDTLMRLGVRDLQKYDEMRQSNPSIPALPRIVIVIDELADLMLVAKAEAEAAICRIAQKARAAGIHLILGTQRPSVEVLTGMIKANVPSVLALYVSSQVDSRTLLGQPGAEKLLGKGDMLFLPIGSIASKRVQGAYVGDDEINRLCEGLREDNGQAGYDSAFTANLLSLAALVGTAKRGSRSDGAEADTSYLKAVRLVIENGSASTSFLQRRLQIGYARAAAMLDRMQEDGIISAPDGAKPRSVLLTFEQFLERLFG